MLKLTKLGALSKKTRMPSVVASCFLLRIQGYLNHCVIASYAYMINDICEVRNSFPLSFVEAENVFNFVITSLNVNCTK